MYLAKRSNGIYYLWYINPATNKKSKVSTRSTTQKGACQFLREFNLQQKLVEKKQSEYSLSKFKEEYLSYSVGVHSPKTYLCYKIALEQFLAFLGDKILRDVGVQDIEQFLTFKISSTSKWSGRKYYAHLASAFQHAIVWDKLTINPFKKVKKPRIPELLPKYFTWEDISKLLNVADDKDMKDIIILAISTGMRLGEIVNLQWSHIDLSRRIIIVQNTNEFSTKSRKNRKIPISNSLLSVLNERKRNEKCNYVFYYEDKHCRPDLITKRFKRYVRQAAIDQTLHFHSLRHSTASLLVQANVPIYTVKEILGHSQISTTMIYAHLAESHLQESINCLNFPVLQNISNPTTTTATGPPSP